MEIANRVQIPSNPVFIGLVGRVFANGLGDLGSIPGRVIPKTLKMVLVTSLLNTQQYISRVKWSNPGKGVVAVEKGAFWLPSTTVANNFALMPLQKA